MLTKELVWALALGEGWGDPVVIAARQLYIPHELISPVQSLVLIAEELHADGRVLGWGGPGAQGDLTPSSQRAPSLMLSHEGILR